MGAQVVVNRHHRIAFVLHWRGRRWWEGTGLTDTQANREKADALAVLIRRSMKAGTFASEYGKFFPGGNKIEQFGGRVPTPAGATTLTQYAKRFLSEVAASKRQSYLKETTLHLRKHILPHLGYLPLAGIRQRHIQGLQVTLLQTKKHKQRRALSVKYVRNIISGTLGAVFTAARKAELVDHDPCERLVWERQPRRRVDPLTAAERDLVLDYFRRKDARYYPLICTLAWTGMRPSEAIGLQWGDVDLRGGTIEIHRSRVSGRDAATKTPDSERTLRGIAPEVVEALSPIRPLRPAPADPVFVGARGAQMRQELVRERRWSKALRAVNVRAVTPYVLRHTFISQALTADCNHKWLTEYVGTSPAMIQKHYGRFMEADASEQLALIRRPASESRRLAPKTSTTGGVSEGT